MYKTVFFILAVAAYSHAQEIRASVLLCPDPKFRSRNVNGILELVQYKPDGPVKITGWVEGLGQNTLHGFHIHEKGNITENCVSTGGHYNPDGKTHGAIHENERHAGDLGNIRSDAKGRAEINIADGQFTLTGPRSVIGRAFVVHALEDDLGKGGHPLSKKTGNAGDRWSCGVIGLA